MKKIIPLFISLLFFSCEAPHENPLDPLNGDSNTAQLTGTVYTISLPREKIAGASITWRNENKSVFSDENGAYEMRISKKTDGFIVCNKEGFFSDSVFIDWEKLTEKSIMFYLNKKTELENASFTSSVIFSNDTTQNQSLLVSIKVKDRDNDVDSITLANKSVGFFSPLDYNIASGFWQRTFSVFDFSVVSLEELIGKEFSVIVIDFDNREIELNCGYLARVITQQPETVTPREDDEVQVPFTITWEKYPANFNFKYQIQIFRNEVPAQLVYEEKNIDKSATSITIEGNGFSVGHYFWTLTVIDEYGNKVRSKPNVFKIGS